jgi:tRNA pseudouridine38-40 synthase
MLTHLLYFFLKPVGNKTTIGILRFRLFFEIWFALYCGTLVNVGLNKITLDDFNAMVHKNRDKAGFSVPAHGLY